MPILGYPHADLRSGYSERPSLIFLICHLSGVGSLGAILMGGTMSNIHESRVRPFLWSIFIIWLPCRYSSGNSMLESQMSIYVGFSVSTFSQSLYLSLSIF